MLWQSSLPWETSLGKKRLIGRVPFNPNAPTNISISKLWEYKFSWGNTYERVKHLPHHYSRLSHQPLCFLTGNMRGGVLLVDSGMVTPAAPLKGMLFLFTLVSVDVVWRWRKEPGPLPVQDQGLWPSRASVGRLVMSGCMWWGSGTVPAPWGKCGAG